MGKTKKVVWLFNQQERGEHSSAVIFWYGILEQLGYEVIYYPYENYEADTFYREMKEYQPDFIFHACYDKFHSEFIRLREFTKIYVVQSDDDWRFESFAKFYIPYVDGTISYMADRYWYLTNGAQENQAVSLLWAFNPNTMLLETQPVRDIHLSHGGNLHANRPALLQEFNSKGMPVVTASNILYGELLDLWSRSKFSLCFTKASVGEFRQKKGRVAEIGFHSVLVSEPFPGIEEYFEPDKEFILFNTVDEAIDKIKYYSSNEAQYQRMLEASTERIWNTNTVFHQWDKVMRVLDEDYKPWNIDNILKHYK